MFPDSRLVLTPRFIANFTSRGSIVLMLRGSFLRRNGARAGALIVSDTGMKPDVGLVDGALKSCSFRLNSGFDDILDRMDAVDENGSGLDVVIVGLTGAAVLVGVLGVGDPSGPFLYLRDRRMDANLSNPSFVPAFELE